MGLHLCGHGLQPGLPTAPAGGAGLIANVPASAKVFAGRWRIVEMDVWDRDVLDIGEEAHLTFEGASDGKIAFVAVKGFLDVRYCARDGAVRSSPGRAPTTVPRPAVAAG